MPATEIIQLLEQVAAQKERLKVEAYTLTGEAKRFIDAGHTIELSWSGSALGVHHALYYTGFQKPPIESRFNVEFGCHFGVPPGWEERSAPDVLAAMERQSGITLAELEGRDRALVDAVKELRSELIIELSALNGASDQLRQIMEELQGLPLDDSAAKKYVARTINSCPHATRDIAAITENFRLPAHTCYIGTALSVQAHCRAAEQFWFKAKQLLRILQAVPQSQPQQGAAGGPGLQSHTYVINAHDNARVNVASTNNSLNAGNGEFQALRAALESVPNVAQRERLLLKVQELESARSNPKAFSLGYKEFVRLAADHMALIAPFIPFLTQLLH